VLIILWPSADGGFNIYGLASIASAFLVAVVMVLIRKLSKVDRPVTILSYQAVGVGLLMFVPMLWFWKTPCGQARPARWRRWTSPGWCSRAFWG
jgi:drug/metabolite transporter (DMT)-like permease